MTKKIFLLSMLAVLILSFKPATEADDLKITKTPVVSIVENTTHPITFEEMENERLCSFQIQITWTGAAEYGVPEYQYVRTTLRAYYESLGKHPIENILNNNSEIWTFHYPCFDDQRINDLRATIEQDPDVDDD
ncbi:MAG: hypothetical protein ACI849_001103 [Patiriisocius sp.]|jgi:hypothetical protein